MGELQAFVRGQLNLKKWIESTKSEIVFKLADWERVTGPGFKVLNPLHVGKKQNGGRWSKDSLDDV